MNASISRWRTTNRDPRFDKLYKLKHDAPFIPFCTITKSRRRYSIDRLRDLALPPNDKGQMFGIWCRGKCIVLKFGDVKLLEPEQTPDSLSSSETAKVFDG